MKTLDFGDFTVHINQTNGSAEICEGDLCEKIYGDEIIELDDISSHQFEIFIMSINVTDKCNFSCKYCFRENKNNRLDLKNVLPKIRTRLFENYPNLKYVRFDLTGSGEPLLEFDNIRDVISSHSLSSNVIEDIGFCTNGSLLDKKKIKFLNKHNIKYGISLDGLRGNNQSRVYKNGNETFEDVLTNIKKSKKRNIGLAWTLTGKSKNICDDFIELCKYFDSIVMKPVRGAYLLDENQSLDSLKHEYNDLIDWLIEETIYGSKKYISKVIGDDDYFGKFLRRIIIRRKVSNRCGAGFSKLALGTDNNFYYCGAAMYYDDFCVGSLETGINHEKLKQLNNIQFEKKSCKECWAEYICGGPCLANNVFMFDDINVIDQNQCEIIQFLIKKAFEFEHKLKTNNYAVYEHLRGLSLDNHYK